MDKHMKNSLAEEIAVIIDALRGPNLNDLTLGRADGRGENRSSFLNDV